MCPLEERLTTTTLASQQHPQTGDLGCEGCCVIDREAEQVDHAARLFKRIALAAVYATFAAALFVAVLVGLGRDSIRGAAGAVLTILLYGTVGWSLVTWIRSGRPVPAGRTWRKFTIAFVALTVAHLGVDVWDGVTNAFGASNVYETVLVVGMATAAFTAARRKP